MWGSPAAYMVPGCGNVHIAQRDASIDEVARSKEGPYDEVDGPQTVQRGSTECPSGPHTQGSYLVFDLLRGSSAGFTYLNSTGPDP